MGRVGVGGRRVEGGGWMIEGCWRDSPARLTWSERNGNRRVKPKPKESQVRGHSPLTGRWNHAMRILQDSLSVKDDWMMAGMSQQGNGYVI